MPLPLLKMALVSHPKLDCIIKHWLTLLHFLKAILDFFIMSSFSFSLFTD